MSTDRSKTGRAQRYRATALDRALAPERIVAVMGPIDDLQTGPIRDTLRTVSDRLGARLALIPDERSPIWGYRSDLGDLPVSNWPAPIDGDIGKLVTDIRHRPGPTDPVEVFVCGDYLVIDYSHGLGDGRFGLTLLAALSGDESARQGIIEKGLGPQAIWTACRRQFASDPRRMRDMLRLRRANKSTAEPPGGSRILSDWQSARRCRVDHMASGQVDELRAWTKAHATGATTASMTMALWMAALRAENVPMDPQVMVLVDCRRYLGEESRNTSGNFAVGLPLHIPEALSPTEITNLTRQVTASAWPAAILGLAEVKARLARTVKPPHPADAQVGDRVRLSVSDLGRVPGFDHVAWSADGRPPQITAYIEPDGPDAVTLLVTEYAGVRTFTSSFCADMIDTPVVERALARVCADPLGVLKADAGCT